MKQRPLVQTAYPFQVGFVATTVPLFIFLALFYPKPYIIFFFSAYYLYSIVLSLYNKYIVDRVNLLDENKRVRVFPGEKTKIKFGIFNSGKIPILQAKINFALEKSLTVTQTGSHIKNDFNLISQYVSLPPEKSVNWESDITAMKRGIFHINDIEIIIYDMFNSSAIHFPAVRRSRYEVLVYPQLKPVAGIEELFKLSQGNSSTSFSLYQDELSISGVKPYEGEGFRQIHWKATARSGQLISKKYQPVIQKGFTICLYLAAEQSFYFHPNMEEFISYTAFLCKYLSEKNIPYELFININSQNEPIQIHLNEGAQHFASCLETLAGLNEEGQLHTASYFNRFVKSKRASDNITVWIGEQSANAQTGFVRTINKDGFIQGGEKRALSIV